MTLNGSELLRKLRTEYRVKQPSFCSHPLIRKVKKVTGVHTYYFKRYFDYLELGDAPDDGFSEGGALYLGPRISKDKHGVLHELCHALVAYEKGKLGEDNFDADQEDEEQTCMIELWLGYETGFYSYETLVHLTRLYSYDYNLEVDPAISHLLWNQKVLIPESEKYTRASVDEFLEKCKETALAFKVVRQVAEEMGILPA